MKRSLIVLALVTSAIVFVSGASSAGQMMTITNVSVSPDRHVTATWTNPPGEPVMFMMIEVSKRPDRATNGAFFEEYVIARDFPANGSTTWTDSRALDSDLRPYCDGKPCGPGTYYISVKGWWGGYSWDDFTNYGTVYSQVVAFTVDPICTKILTKAGFYKKVLVKKGRFVTRNGKRVWVKPVYKKVWVKPVYRTECK